MRFVKGEPKSTKVDSLMRRELDKDTWFRDDLSIKTELLAPSGTVNGRILFFCPGATAHLV